MEIIGTYILFLKFTEITINKIYADTFTWPFLNKTILSMKCYAKNFK